MTIFCIYADCNVEPEKQCLIDCKDCQAYKEEKARQKNVERMEKYAKTVSK